MRLADPHLNVFHAYRGVDSDGGEGDRQLENNLTRALAITLNALGPHPSRARLLETLGVPSRQVTDFVRCELQVSSPDPAWSMPGVTRLLTALLGSSRSAKGRPAHPRTRSVPDLIVIGDKYVLGVEAKVGNSVSEVQLAAHRKTLGLPPSASVHEVTWSALAKDARAPSAGRGLEVVPRFLLQQFEEYLRMNGFGGFTNGHFAYFALSPEDRASAKDTKAAIRRQLFNLLQSIKAESRSRWGIEQGNIRDDSPDAYAALKPAAASKGGQLPHLSVALDSSGLQVFLNVETDRAYTQFTAAWKADAQRFVDLFRGLSTAGETAANVVNPWRLRVLYRVPTGRPRANRVEPSFEISALTARAMPTAVLEVVVAEAVKKPAGGWTPEITVARRYTPTSCTDPNLAERLAADFKNLEPLFDWVGQPVR